MGRISGESFKSVLSVCANLWPISNQLEMNTGIIYPACVHPQISILLSLLPRVVISAQITLNSGTLINLKPVSSCLCLIEYLPWMRNLAEKEIGQMLTLRFLQRGISFRAGLRLSLHYITRLHNWTK